MPTPSELLKNSPRHSIFGNYRADDSSSSGRESAPSDQSRLTSAATSNQVTLQTKIDQAIARSFIYRFLAKAFEDGEAESWHWLASEQTKTSLAAAFRALPPFASARSPGKGEVHGELPPPTTDAPRDDERTESSGSAGILAGVSPSQPKNSPARMPALPVPVYGAGGRKPGEAEHAALTNSFHQLDRAFVRSAGDSFALAYLTCFGHTVRGDCPMNEIEYGDIKADPLFQPHRLSDLGAFYAAFGLEVTADAAERVDHISIELEFMSVLAAKEAYAIEHQFDAEQLALLQDAQKKFLREHLGRWAPAFTRRLAKMAADTPLGVLAQWTGEFVKVECARLNVPPGSEDLLLRPVDEASESLCASCGLVALPPGAATTGPM